MNGSWAVPNIGFNSFASRQTCTSTSQIDFLFGCSVEGDEDVLSGEITLYAGNPFAVCEFGKFSFNVKLNQLSSPDSCDPFSVELGKFWWYYGNGPTPPQDSVLSMSYSCGVTGPNGYIYAPLDNGTATITISE